MIVKKNIDLKFNKIVMPGTSCITITNAHTCDYGFVQNVKYLYYHHLYYEYE